MVKLLEERGFDSEIGSNWKTERQETDRKTQTLMVGSNAEKRGKTKCKLAVVEAMRDSSKLLWARPKTYCGFGNHTGKVISLQMNNYRTSSNSRKFEWNVK